MLPLSKNNLEAALLAIPMELERIRAQLEAGLAETHNGLRIQGARYLPVGGRPEAWNAAGRLVGWSVHNPAPYPVIVYLRDGQDTFGDRVVGIIDLDAGETQTVSLGGPGVFFTAGLYLDRQAEGNQPLVGAVYIGVTD